MEPQSAGIAQHEALVKNTESLTRARAGLAWGRLAAALLGLLLLLAGLWRLDDVASWWDEGWTLTVARTWVERGFYGRLLAGQLVAANLQADFSVTAPAALGMWLFGVGMWQGRLFGLLLALAALGMYVHLARRLYGPRAAAAALAVLLLTPVHPQLHALLIGRLALAEMPMLAYLLAGYLCTLWSLERSRWWLLPGALLWGVAINSKGQALPFWLLSLLAPLALCLLGRRWRPAATLALLLAGGLLAARGLVLARTLLLAGRSLPPEPLSGLYEVTGLVLAWPARWQALKILLAFGLPAAAGAAWALRGWWRARPAWHAPAELLRLALLTMVVSWLAWFGLLSAGFERYLFPAVFFAAMFVAALLERLSAGFDLAGLIPRAARTLRPPGRTRDGLAAWAALLFLTATVPLTLLQIYTQYVTEADRSNFAVAEFLNRRSPPAALVETYDSELFVLLQRPYHYPPDQTHIELNRRLFRREPVPIAYDPLAADPDYLVVGWFNRMWGTYDAALASGQFREVFRSGQYVVYQRAPAQGGQGEHLSKAGRSGGVAAAPRDAFCMCE